MNSIMNSHFIRSSTYYHSGNTPFFKWKILNMYKSKMNSKTV